jgi:hypothetical protein
MRMKGTLLVRRSLPVNSCPGLQAPMTPFERTFAPFSDELAVGFSEN